MGHKFGFIVQLYACKVLKKDGEITEKKIFADEDLDFYELFKKSELLFISKSIQKSSIRHPITEFTLPFFKNLAQLVKNKLNLMDALEIVKNLFKNSECQLIVDAITQQIRMGSNLSIALSKFERYFDKLSVKTIEVSEKTAELPVSLEKIVKHLDENLNLKNKIKESLRYPLVLIIFISFTFLFWIFVLVPKFAEFFHEINIQPPLMSRIVINLSKFMTNNIWGIIIVSLSLIFVTNKYFQLGRKLKQKLPIFNKINHEIQIYNFFTAMELMLCDKINLLEALECVSDTTSKVAIVIDLIKSGRTFSEALQKTKILNEYELSIINAGEHAGDLCSAFKSIAETSKQNIENVSRKMLEIIPSIAMIFIGLLLIILVYALLIPLYSNLNVEF